MEVAPNRPVIRVRDDRACILLHAHVTNVLSCERALVSASMLLAVLARLALLPASPPPGQRTVEGNVIGRRALGKKMVFVDLCTSDGGELQALLKAPREVEAAECLTHPLDRMLYDMGARVRVLGHMRPAKLGRPLLVAREATLLTAAPSAHGVRHVLEAASRGAVEPAEAAAALTPDTGDVAFDQEVAALLRTGPSVPDADVDRVVAEACAGLRA